MYKKYLKDKISCIYVDKNKRPIMQWKKYQQRLPTESELTEQSKINNAFGIAVICGKVSGNLEIIDIDCKYDLTGSLFEDFISQLSEDITSSIFVVSTKNKGFHIYYYCEKIDNNLKLALRPTTPEEIEKSPHEKVKVLIETRGEGGYCVAPPTEGYQLNTGSVIPTYTPEQREKLLTIARSFNQVFDEERPRVNREISTGFSKTPWEDYNNKADAVGLLIKHGWVEKKRKGERIIMKRPGDTDSLSSGDYHTGLNLFKVFSTSTIFEPGRGYTPFAIYAFLEHDKDFSKAAKQLILDGYGERSLFVDRKISTKVSRALSAGHNREKIIDMLMSEEAKSREEAKALVDDIINNRGEIIQTFWEVEEHKTGARITILKHKLIDFLYESGFFLFFYDKNSIIYRIVREKDGFLEDVSSEGIKKFIKYYIQDLPDKFDSISPNKLLECIMKSSDYFGPGLMEFLDTKNIDILRDSEDTIFFPFKNGIVVVTQEGATLVNYGDVKKCVWKRQVIDFNIDVDNNFNENLCEFWKFISKIAGDDEDNISYLLTLIGYLLHQYKDPARPFSVIFAEETENDNKGGGTGKGIIVTALSYMSNIERIDGKNFKVDKSFAFQRVGLDTKIIAIEDVRKDVDFEGFYSIITEGITVEKKNKDELFIPYKDSPKVLFTTNYTIPSVGGHAKRRQRVFEFSQFFSNKNNPIDYFGHKLFDDWDEDEWNRFYNFMFFCANLYLIGGVQEKPQGDKIKRKHIRLNYSEEFLDWWDENHNLSATTYKPFRDLYGGFLASNDYDKKDYSQKRFKRALIEVCESFGFELLSRRNPQSGFLEYMFKKI